MIDSQSQTSASPVTWAREVVRCGRVQPAPSAASVRLSAAAAIGSVVLGAAALGAGAILGRGESILVTAILFCSAAVFWYITSRDGGRRDAALARERDLLQALTDVELRLASGAGTEARRSALADLAEWISLRSRLNGGHFDLDAWRRFTAEHGTPVAIAFGVPVPEPTSLAPTYEAIDLESERPGLSKGRLAPLGAIILWFAFVLSGGAGQALGPWLLLWLAGLAAMILYEFGIQPVALTSFVVSPERVEEGGWGRTRSAEAGAGIALIEQQPGASRLHPPTFLLTVLGGAKPLRFALRHDRDARIGLFLASWLTPRDGEPAATPDQDPADEPRSHHPPHGAIPAGTAGPAGGPSR